MAMKSVRRAYLNAMFFIASVLMTTCSQSSFLSDIEAKVDTAKAGGSPVATPTFSLSGGTYSSDQSVTISDSTAGAAIYYTTDGTTPTSAMPAYSGPISIAGNGTTMTIKAMAAKTGMNNSSLAMATYTIYYYPALWAKTLTSGSSDALFRSVAVDSSGNSYAVGYISGPGSYGFGNSVTATGTSSGKNVLLVKYDSSGTAQWAKTLTSGSSDAYFGSVAIDSSGNIYAVGSISSTGSFGFGNGMTATGTSSGYNVLLVKYDSSGTAQWAQTQTSGSSYADFTSVAVDNSGNIYAVGSISSTGSFGFGNGMTATGTSSGYNVLVVKYDSSGSAQWAKTLTSGTDNAYFNSVALGNSGNIYAVGLISSTGSFGFGNGVTATGTSSGKNGLLVKYNSSGTAQWAKTLTSGSSYAIFISVAVDNSDNSYAVGNISGPESYGFGNGVTATGTSSGNNGLLVKYNSSGTAQWAQTQTSGSSYSFFNSVALDNSGNMYVVGEIDGTGSHGFGNSITATGTSGNNVLFVKYNASGTAQWAQTQTSGSPNAYFSSVAVDSSGGTSYAVGGMTSMGIYGFGNGVTATGTASNFNVLLVKY